MGHEPVHLPRAARRRRLADTISNELQHLSRGEGRGERGEGGRDGGTEGGRDGRREGGRQEISESVSGMWEEGEDEIKE